MALLITLAIAAVSAFFVIVGSPYSEVAVTRQCPTGSQCVETQEFRTYSAPEHVAVVPLLMGTVVALGLVTKRMILAWSGTIPLLFFSVLTGFSIGPFYMPLAVTLVGFLAFIHNRGNR